MSEGNTLPRVGPRKEVSTDQPTSDPAVAGARAREHDTKAEAVANRTLERGATGARAAELKAASEELEKLPVASAIGRMQELSPYLLQVYLIAEGWGLGRAEVMRQFPKVGPSFRARYENPAAG